VFSTYSSLPPGSDFQLGSPSVETTSVGCDAAMMRGGTAGAGSLSSSFGMFWTRSAGGVFVTAHGPIGDFAAYQSAPLVR
jgi:hypothetical protein